MRTRFLRSMVIISALCIFCPGAYAQTATAPAAKPATQAAKGVPDLSGTWEAHRTVPLTAKTALCGIATVCSGLLGVAREPAGDTTVEPEMTPWAEEKYKAVRRGREQNDFGRQDLDPNFSGCMPEGPTDLLIDNRRIFELQQFPDEVLLLFDDDHWVRRIYIDGRPHPANLTSTWMGHSIGRYEGDTLVVDTVGINDKSWIDRVGHPHSDQLHLTERIRRVNNSLEYEYTIDDPKAYVKPWTKKAVHDLLPPNALLLEGVLCEELLEMGTHYSAKK